MHYRKPNSKKYLQCIARTNKIPAYGNKEEISERIKNKKLLPDTEVYVLLSWSSMALPDIDKWSKILSVKYPQYYWVIGQSGFYGTYVKYLIPTGTTKKFRIDLKNVIKSLNITHYSIKVSKSSYTDDQIRVLDQDYVTIVKKTNK